MSAASSPLVSIALSMRDAAATIGPAIRSLLAQSCADWELLVLDDGSSDRSVDLVLGFEDERIHVRSDGAHLGLATRLNQAIDLARGRYLARMDADDIAYPDRLRRQVDYLQTHSQVDLVGSSMMVFEGEGKAVGVFPARATHAEICARPFSGFHLAHPSWMGKLEWFRRWRYDPLCRKAQDQDLLLRAFSTSCFAALSEPLVGYRQDALSIRKSVLGRYYFSRAILRAARRDGQVASGALAVAEQIAKLVFDTFAMVTGQGRTMLRHRALPFTDAQASAWRQVWRACCPQSTGVPAK
jgi:glycosyltransferase involved in cell wall biosynthesis